jgi:hypothetical protein
LTACTDWWVFGVVGNPQPKSMNWLIPWFAAQVAARERNWRFSTAMSAISGTMVSSRSATSRSAG